MDIKTATFIIGCGHSGTTLLANMFACHPLVYVPLRETETFISKKFHESDRFEEKWWSMYEELHATGKLHLIEKTPRHLLVMNRIRKHVPIAKFIIMVRDGRDVAASFIKRNGSAKVGADRWVSENRIVINEAKSRDVCLIRYEDLICYTEDVLKKLCKFIGCGMTYEEGMLEYYKEPKLWFGVKELAKGTGAEGEQHNLLRSWQVNQPKFDGRGQWKTMLSDEEKAYFDSGEAKDMLDYFGYS